MPYLSPWRLPGPAAWLDRLAELIAEGSSLILVGSEGCPPELRLELGDRLAERGVSLLGRQLRPVAAEPPPLTLARELAAAPERCAIAPRLLLEPGSGLGAGLIWIEGLDAAGTAVWCAYLNGLAHDLRGVPLARRPRFVLPVREAPAEFCADLLWRRHDWQGQTSQLDLLLYASALLPAPARGQAAMAAQQLRAQLVAELAQGDLARCEELSALDLATLCMATDRRAVWRAQLKVLFPLAEARRLELIETCRTALRLPHPTGDGRLIADALELELGHLLYQVQRYGLRLDRDELAQLAYWRNRLAHLQALSAAELAHPATQGLLALAG